MKRAASGLTSWAGTPGTGRCLASRHDGPRDRAAPRSGHGRPESDDGSTVRRVPGPRTSQTQPAERRPGPPHTPHRPGQGQRCYPWSTSQSGQAQRSGTRVAAHAPVAPHSQDSRAGQDSLGRPARPTQTHDRTGASTGAARPDAAPTCERTSSLVQRWGCTCSDLHEREPFGVDPLAVSGPGRMQLRLTPSQHGPDGHAGGAGADAGLVSADAHLSPQCRRLRRRALVVGRSPARRRSLTVLRPKWSRSRPSRGVTGSFLACREAYADRRATAHLWLVGRCYRQGGAPPPRCLHRATPCSSVTRR